MHAAGSARPASARGVVPKIALLTEAELATAPAYMKSRLDVTKVNATVVELQKLLSAKYTLLAASSAQVRTMHEVEKKKHAAYKLLETSETRGTFFLSEEDLKGTQQLKSDATGKNLIAVLRHVGRLKEFRTQGQRCFRVLLSNEMR